VTDAEGKVVYRLCHRSSTRPMGLPEGGTVLYWDGALKDGTPAPAGAYRIWAQATLNDGNITVTSEPFLLK
jgi:flagellar hook assembly protein FlgD